MMIALALAVLLAIAHPATAQEIRPTLDKIKEAGVIHLGYRETSRPFSFATDCSNNASRLAAWSARIRDASCSSGLSPRSGSRCETTRPRFVSMTSDERQHGQVTSISLFSLAMRIILVGSRSLAVGSQDLRVLRYQLPTTNDRLPTH